MTLRLIQDDEHAVVPCEYGHGPATLLVIINGTPGLPCCDECARGFYRKAPNHVQLASLDGYVDHFAAAREAALAPPAMPSRDQGLYCQFDECANPADYFIRLRNEPDDGALACSACLHKWQLAHPAGRLIPFSGHDDELPDAAGLTDRIWICPMSAELKDYLLDLQQKAYASAGNGNNGSNGHGNGGKPPAGGPTNPGMHPETARHLQRLGIPAAISFVLGFALCIAGLPDGRVSGSQPNGPVIIVGVLLILAAIVTGIVALVKIADAQAKRYQGWKTTLTPQQQAGIGVAEVAAMAAGAYAVHEGLKHHREHVAAQRAATRARQDALQQHQQAMQNNYWQQQDNAAAGLGYKTNDQIGYGALVTHRNGPGPTRRSDIYGNLI